MHLTLSVSCIVSNFSVGYFIMHWILKIEIRCFSGLNIVFTGLPVWQSQSESGWDLFASRKAGGICSFYLFIYLFSMSVKVLPVTPLVGGVFVRRAFCAYFLRIERVVEMRRFLWWTQ